ncbi:hypothetical protein FHU29_002681 [Hoyosella altamirensis]|uniref:Uncharacterized protein n=1 Tax=Hoyosella altamirensis TaxID=616997 RepID=A0A839RMR1_9ACTN|nr:hypothetical protein [Hoyosella altamirensis]
MVDDQYRRFRVTLKRPAGEKGGSTWLVLAECGGGVLPSAG